MKVTVASDYDGYFENLVRRLVADHVGEFAHDEIVVSASPYRPSAVTYRSEGKTIYLNWYSALRRGFGGLSEKDLEELSALL